MTRLLVLGGTGFFGTRVATMLGRLDAVEVQVAGRRSRPVRVDLNDPDTFGPLREVDAVVNVSDSVNAPPDAAIAEATAAGVTWFELSADLETVRRLTALDDPRLVLGVGVFPGLSTALGRHVAEGCERLEVGVRLSPLSGAGRGNCALMTRMLVTPGVWTAGGATREGPAVGPAAPMAFPVTGRAVAARVGLPDAVLLGRAAPSVEARLALRPTVGLLGFRLAALMLRLAGPLRRPLLWLTERSLYLARGLLLRRVPSRVELVARGTTADGVERVASLDLPDGHDSAALGAAAYVSAWRAGEGYDLPTLLAHARRLDAQVTFAEGA